MYDAVIIGAGHNGLTTAAYLSKAGLKVLVLERRELLGGAAVTETICPGYQASSASYVVSLLHQQIVDDLQLKNFGYEPIPIVASFGPELDGQYMLTTGADTDKQEFEKFSLADHANKKQFERRLSKVSGFLREQMLRIPPKLYGATLLELLPLLKVSKAYRKLTADERHLFIQILTSSADDILNFWFESEVVKKSYASSVTVGSFNGLSVPGSAINLLHLSIGEIEGVRGGWAIAKGGMGAVSGAIAQAATTHGANILTNTAVEEIIVKNGRATGVRLDDGTEIQAKIVVANSDPKRTFLKLLDPRHLPADFRKGIEVYKMGSGTLRINLALSELPEFACIPGKSMGLHHQAFIRFIPSLKEMEQNYLAARMGEIPTAPIIDALIPSTHDDALAPPGGHVLSLLCQHYPYQLGGNRSWDDVKQQVVAGIVDHLTQYIPKLKSIIVGMKVLTPLDLERDFGLTNGDVYHGSLSLDQMFSLRPHPASAQYATPVKRLYLCGAGTHPGGGVSGAPGYNAAQKILNDKKNGL